VSDDGVEFRLAGERQYPLPVGREETAPVGLGIPFPAVAARYLHVQAKNTGVCPPWHGGAGGKAWLFVDEVIVD
jgi:hexosaminidase